MAKIPRVTCLDFETEPIQKRPHYPPKPVSFSLKLPTWKKPKFYSWGHKTGGNNCTEEDARRVLTEAYAQISESNPLLCQNAKFDLDVAEVHFGLTIPDWRCWHDTMFLLFLQDPHQRSLGLKPSAQRLLGMAPDEQDAVKEWLMAHKKQLELDFPEIVNVFEGIKPSTVGAFIAYVPAKVVGPYADGDVDRTVKLFNLLYPEILDRGMGEAYDRERRLLPILLANERDGICVDTPAMERDQALFEDAQLKVDDWIRKALKSPGLDLDRDAEVAETLHSQDALTEYTYTDTGRLSVSKKNMKLAHFKDQKLAAAYSYRQKCATMLETFIRPWQRYAHNGVLNTNWNQVRQTGGGTRTGRPSTDAPNLLNVPKNVKGDSAVLGFMMPTHIAGLPKMPSIRGYILPDHKSHWVGRRDLSQQELRVLAHYEDGALLQAYLKDPKLDVHEFVRQSIEDTIGVDVGRGFTKTLNFGYVYGMGVGSLAESMGKPVAEVKKIRDAQMRALPGLKQLNDDIKARAKQGLPITTWGGRQYFCEEPYFDPKTGKTFTWEYKLLNYLIQGGSADITKEAIIRYHDVRKDGRMLLTVYDEIDISAPKKLLKQEMLIMREAMMSVMLDVPLLSDGEIGPTLGNLEALKNEPSPDLSQWGIK